ncbi:hypothetical protein B0H14DRAFT_3555836 [Mycena olivaceomarginata]|nr:hypothetical protein B0H14DRAFT_3555836 [Mycena olivaceomarginata]
MSSQPTKLAPTNLPVEELVMDDRGVKDPRYYCLPPFRGDPSHPSPRPVEAKASLTGFPDHSNQGCHTEEECIEVWQRLCVLGVHPHPVNPAFFSPPSVSASALVNTSPRKSARPSGVTTVKHGDSPTKGQPPSPIKREGTSSRGGAATAELLRDLKKYASPILPTPGPSPSRATPGAQDDSFVNFAIRGLGVVSSSAERSQQRYLELQRRGEEPDFIITRSFAQASLFALDDEDEEDQTGGT